MSSSELFGRPLYLQPYAEVGVHVIKSGALWKGTGVVNKAYVVQACPSKWRLTQIVPSVTALAGFMSTCHKLERRKDLS